MPFLTISDASRQIGCRPRDISDAFYSRELDESRCPILGGRRIIPVDYLPTVRETLERKGKAQREVVAQ